MKINEVQRVGGINPYRKANEDKLAQTDGMKQKKKDEVNISSEAKELQVSKGVVNQHLEDLKQSYLTDTYKVPAREIAEKLFPYLK